MYYTIYVYTRVPSSSIKLTLFNQKPPQRNGSPRTNFVYPVRYRADRCWQTCQTSMRESCSESEIYYELKVPEHRPSHRGQDDPFNAQLLLYDGYD